MMFSVQKIHFVGIGGSGMNGIAEVFHNLGYEVTGSDISQNAATAHLTELGIEVYVGHAPEHVEGVDVVVASSAIRDTNPEIIEAKRRRIPVVPRALMLAELMRFKEGIAVAGAHGKTTTTSLIASVLGEAGLDPTFVIGGKLNAAGSNARLGSGEWLVAEADESDASFLCLTPVIALVTNIDEDHMDTYGHDFNKLKQAFVDFLMRLPFYGKAVLCADDANLMSIVDRVPRSVILYGESEKAQVRAVNIRAEGTGMRFTVVRENRPDLDIFLSHPGIHSVKNALGAIAVGGLLGIKDDVFVRAFAGFKGVGRRFTQLGEIEIDGGTFTLIDDYGHHPREMAATIAAARGAFPGRRIVLAFQPHRFTRTRDCFEDFVGILSSVDALVLTEVYPAGEAPIPGADARSLARAVRAAGQERLSFAPTIDEVIPTIMKTARPGDVVLTVGAGSIGKIASRLKAGER